MKIDYSHHYRKWHDDSEAHQGSMIAHYRKVLTGKLSVGKEAKVLDVGCGMGFALLTLRELGFANIQGVEADEGQAKSCREKGLEVELTEDTIAFLKKKAGFYDLILCLDVIEHFPVGLQMEFVQALAAALRPNGQFICTVPNANSSLAGRWRYIDWTHTSSFTETSLDFLLYNGGFTDITISGYEFNVRPRQVLIPVGGVRHWWAFRFFRFWRRLELMAELGPAAGRNLPLSLNLIATARAKGSAG